MKKADNKNFWEKIAISVVLGSEIAALIIFVYAGYFLYKNFYKAMFEARDIISIQRKSALKKIDMKKFEEAVEKIDKKGNKNQALNIKNFFEE